MGLMAQKYIAASLKIISGPTDFVFWSAPILPMLLDRDPQNGEWIVVAGADSLQFWNANGQPCPRQWAFRLHNGSWYLQPIPESLIGRKPNLLLDLRVSDDKDFSSNEFASVAQVRKARQTDTGERISPTMRFVGDSNEVTVACKAPGPPRFTGPFHAFEEPNLASFPRMP